jgi:O-antigen ligase
MGRTAFRSNATVALLATTALLLVIAAAIYFSRAETISRLMATDVNEETRFDVWGGIVQAIGAYFPVGSGIGSFVDVYRAFEPRELLRPTYLNHAHNDWLEWPMETGLPGLLLLVGGIVAFAVRAFKLFFRAGTAGEDARLARVGAIFILLLGLASVVDYPARVPVIGALAMLAMVWMANARAGSAGRDDAA